MKQPAAYEREPYRRELPATVVETGVEGDRPFALLDDTILYPEGGGQPSDRGSLGKVAVVDVQRKDGEVRHYLAAPVAPGPVLVRLDWERRFDHMQQHTGQHLLTAVAADRFGWETTAFHLGPSVCDVELDIPAIAPSDLARLEEDVAGEIRAARKVTVRRVTPAEMAALPVRSRGLPEGHAGDVRLVEIAGVDLNTCGGTHLASTGELEALKLLGTEKLRGGTRLSFVAGGRVRRRLGAHEARAAALRVLLGAPDEGLAAAVEAKLGQLSAAEKALRAAEEELAGALARALSAEAGPAVALHLPGRDMAFLMRVGKVFSALPASSVALLTVDGPAGEAFVLAAGAASTAPVPELGPVVAEALEGRGGGSGKLFQGKGAVSRRDEALRLLNERLARG